MTEYDDTKTVNSSNDKWGSYGFLYHQLSLFLNIKLLNQTENKISYWLFLLMSCGDSFLVWIDTFIVADPEFPRSRAGVGRFGWRGHQLVNGGRKLIIWYDIFKKLHKKERKWTGEEGRVASYPIWPVNVLYITEILWYHFFFPPFSFTFIVVPSGFVILTIFTHSLRATERWMTSVSPTVNSRHLESPGSTWYSCAERVISDFTPKVIGSISRGVRRWTV